MVLLTTMPSASQYGQILGSVLPIVLLFVVFYFFLIRPQSIHSGRRRDLDHWRFYWQGSQHQG